MAGSAFVSSLRCHLWFKAHFEIPNVCVDRFGVKGSNITASERWGTRARYVRNIPQYVRVHRHNLTKNNNIAIVGNKKQTHASTDWFVVTPRVLIEMK